MMEIFQESDRPISRTSLQGKRVVITRAAHQAQELTALLRQHGAVPLLYPCITINLIEDFSLLDAALIQVAKGHYDWLIVTSANTPPILAQRMQALNLATTAFSKVKIAAVGSATAKAVETYLGVKAAALPNDYRAKALARAIIPQEGMRVLLPQAEIAPATLVEDLHLMGVYVDKIAIYRTTAGQDGVNLSALLRRQAVDAIIFASPSAVRGFVERMTTENNSLPDLEGIVIACIGPSTRQTALDYGLDVTVMPSVFTLEALVTSLENTFDNQ